MRRGRRCVFCKSSCLRRCLVEYWRWICDSCERIQPDKRYPPPEDIAAFQKRKNAPKTDDLGSGKG